MASHTVATVLDIFLTSLTNLGLWLQYLFLGMHLRLMVVEHY